MNTNKLQVAKHLTDQEHQQLIDTHSKHSQYMDTKTQEKYSLENIKKVKRSADEQGILEVYWDDEWWHYTANHQWY